MRRLKLISKDKFESILARGEESLNLVGYVPFLSVASGALRSLGGLLQLILGFSFAIGYFCAFRYSKQRKIQHLLYMKTGFSHGFHGIANWLRAKIEIIPFLSLLVCLPYDRFFKKRFKYSIEKLPEVKTEGVTIEI